MRGRTNVGGGNGIFVNGNIDFYTIVEGNSITAGDFVSRKIIPEIQEVYGANVSITGGEKVGENLYLFLVGDYLRILEYNGNEIKIIYTYSAQTYSLYSVDNATGKVWALKDNGIDRFEVSGTKLVYFDEFDLPQTGILATYVNDEVLSILYTYYKNSSYYGLAVQRYNIEGENLISDESGNKIISEALRNNEKKVLSIYGGRIYFAAYGNWSYRITTGTSPVPTYELRYINSGYIYRVDLSQEIGNISLETLKTIYDGGSSGTTSAPSSTYKISEIVEIGENNILVAYYARIGNNTINTALHHINLESGTENVFPFSDFEMEESSSYFSLSHTIGENKFIASSGKDYAVLELNAQTLRITRISNILSTIYGTYNSSIIQENNICFIVNYLQKLDAILFTIVDGKLDSSGEQKIIQSYDKNIGSIGLAKNSGKAGDTIAVYIPR